MKHLTVTALCLLAAQAASAQDVGLVEGSFSTRYMSGGASCNSLLVTGQFIAPNPGYVLTLAPKDPQQSALVYELELTATPGDGAAPQVITLLPVTHSDPGFSDCPYGVSVSYEDQQTVTGFLPATTALR